MRFMASISRMNESDAVAGTLHSQVLDALGTAIVDEELTSADSLTIDDLEQRYSASRSVVRESIRVLESMGMVRARRRVGVEILPSTEWSSFDARLIHWRLASKNRADQLRNLVELRRAVEPEAARLAAMRIGPAAAGELVSRAARVWAAGTSGNMEDFVAQDVQFHRLIMTESGNDMFGKLSSLIGEVISGRAAYGLMPHSHSPYGLQLHLDVANAIQSRNSAGAAQALLEIIDLTQEEIKKISEGELPGNDALAAH